MKWLRRAAVGLLGLALAGVVAAWIYSRLALPRTDGELAIAGLASDVRIERDAHGIPTIRAATAEDAMFGLGFVHAQDRLWQLETHRRIGSGRLAEAFGRAGARDRPVPARARRAPRGGGAVGTRRPRGARRGRWPTPPASMPCIGDGMRARPPEMLLLGIQPGALDAGRQPRLGDHDGLGPRRQLVAPNCCACAWR